MPNSWLQQIQERADRSPATSPVPEATDTGDDYGSTGGNSTVRFQAHRAAKVGATGRGVTAEDWLVVLEGFDYRCAYCLERLPLEMDHLEPLPPFGDGQHDVLNVVPACKSCNSSKKDLPHLVWLATRAAKGKRVGA